MTTKVVIEALTYTVPLLLLFGLAICGVRLKKMDGTHRVLFGYLTMALLIDLTSRVVGLKAGNNLFCIPLFGLLELSFFTFIYARFFLKNQPKIIFLFPALALAFILIELLSFQWKYPAYFNAYSRVVDPIAVVIMCLFHYRELGNCVPLPKNRWRLNSAILLFFSLSMLFFLPVNFMINVPSQVKFYLWMANLMLTLVFYAFLIRELWKNGKIQQLLPSGY